MHVGSVPSWPGHRPGTEFIPARLRSHVRTVPCCLFFTGNVPQMAVVTQIFRSIDSDFLPPRPMDRLVILRRVQNESGGEGEPIQTDILGRKEARYAHAGLVQRDAADWLRQSSL